MKLNKNLKLFLHRFSTDSQFKTKLTLYFSVSFNLLYALFQLVMGIRESSVWFYALSAYYAVLGSMRFFLLKETVSKGLGRNYFRELLHYRFCGILLLIMHLSLSVIVGYMVLENKGFTHHYIVTLAIATYTFAAIGVAIKNAVKYHRSYSPVISASKVISLVAALVSLLSLEAAMLSAFGSEEEESFRLLMTAFTGAGVCLAVLATAVYMIVRSTKEINRIKEENKNGK